jgi:hypothetical protein
MKKSATSAPADIALFFMTRGSQSASRLFMGGRRNGGLPL